MEDSEPSPLVSAKYHGHYLRFIFTTQEQMRKRPFL